MHEKESNTYSPEESWNKMNQRPSIQMLSQTSSQTGLHHKHELEDTSWTETCNEAPRITKLTLKNQRMVR